MAAVDLERGPPDADSDDERPEKEPEFVIHVVEDRRPVLARCTGRCRRRRPCGNSRLSRTSPHLVSPRPSLTTPMSPRSARTVLSARSFIAFW
ncbi:hypothetical protein EJB05_15079, partial [Eragrostis curvula]